jgi:hypothetical protein
MRGLAQMTAKTERSKTQEVEVAQEIVDGLENTLSWMRSQFETFRNDVGMSEKAVSAGSFN